MTIAELIAHLSELPQDLRVVEVDYTDHAGPRYIDIDDVYWPMRREQVTIHVGPFQKRHYRRHQTGHGVPVEVLVL